MTSQRFDYFVIIGAMRTGSNLLERSLQHFDDLACYGEVYNPDFVGFHEVEKSFDISVKERDRNPLDFLQVMQKDAGQKLAGFRIFPDHNPTILQHCLQLERCGKIVLRRNPLDSFVSLKLAEKTDQWRMGDLHTKVEAKVHFDPLEFEHYLQTLRLFYDGVNRELQVAGQTAMQVDFDDLQNVDAVNGIAQFLGSTKKITKFKFRSSKQNANALVEKVENFKEIENFRNPILNMDRAQFEYSEPKTTRATKNLYLGSNIELAYLPTRNSAPDPIVAWMSVLDPKNETPKSGLSKRAVNEWFNEAGLKFCFADLEHPVERAYNAFCDLFLLPGSDRYAGIRATLGKRYGLDLLAGEFKGSISRNELEKAGYSIEKHKSNFQKFLRFLKASLQDQALYQPKPEFCSQTEQLSAYAEWAVPHFVALPHTRQAVFGALIEAMGLNVASLPKQAERDDIFGLDEIYDLKIENLTRKAYSRDYRNFGFLDYSISPK